jgi:hypothetical protein
MARGNGRQNIVRDNDDRCRLEDYLGRAVVRCSWRVYAYVIMSKYFHLIVNTLSPTWRAGCRCYSLLTPTDGRGGTAFTVTCFRADIARS